MEEGKYWYPAILFGGVAAIIIILLVIGLFVVNYPPAPPLNLNIERQGGEVIMSWLPSSSPDVVEYRIYRSVMLGDEGEFIEAVYNNTQYTDNPEYDGTYYYIIKAYDGQFESANSEQTSFYYDLHAPVITSIILPTGTNAVNIRNITFYITTDSQTSECQIVNHTNWFMYNMGYTFTLESSEQKQYTFYFRCKDQYNNIGKKYAFTFAYDTIAPEIERILPTEEYSPSRDVVFKFAVNEPSYCKFFMGTKTLWENDVDGSAEFEVTMLQSDYMFSCKDLAGNTNVYTGRILSSISGALSLQINNNENVTYERNVSLQISFTSFIENMTCEIYNIKLTNSIIRKQGSSEFFTPENGHQTLDWELSKGYGKKYVYVLCKFENQTIGTAFDSINYQSNESYEYDNDDDNGEGHAANTNPPTELSVKINNGQECTNTPGIEIFIKVKNSKECSCQVDDNKYGYWQPGTYQTAVLSVDSGTKVNNEKHTVTCKCRNDYGETDEQSDSIIFDNKEPDRVTSLGAEQASSKIELSWQYASADTNPYEYFEIYRYVMAGPKPTGLPMQPQKIGQTKDMDYIDMPVSQAKYAYYVMAVDCAKNKGQESEVKTIYFDTTPPTVEIIDAGGTVTNPNQEIGATVDDNYVSTVSCIARNNGVQFASNDNVYAPSTWLINVQLSEGINLIVVDCWDGNNQASDSITFNYNIGQSGDSEDEDIIPPSE